MRSTDATRECLRDWIEESSSDDFKRYKKDQDAMDSILRKGSVCTTAIHTMSSAYIETFDDNMILPLFGVIRGKTPTFPVTMGTSCYGTLHFGFDSICAAHQSKCSKQSIAI